MLFSIIYCLFIISSCFHRPPCDWKIFLLLRSISILRPPRHLSEIFATTSLLTYTNMAPLRARAVFRISNCLKKIGMCGQVWLMNMIHYCHDYRGQLFILHAKFFFFDNQCWNWLISRISHLTTAPAFWCRFSETFATTSP